MRTAAPRRGTLLAASLAAAMLAVAPAAHAVDTAPSPAPTPVDAVTWGTGPTDNAVGTGRPNFSYDAKPGGELDDSIDVVNRSDRALELTIYAADAFTTDSGALDLLPGGEDSVDAGTWIALAKDHLTVPAGATVSVPFTLDVPANATPGDHTAGIVTSLVTAETDGQVSVDRRIGSRVLVRVAGELTPSLSVGDVQVSFDGTLNPFTAGTATVTYTVTNTGNVRLAARRAVSAGGPFGLLQQTVHPDDLPELLPGASLTLQSTVPGVWPTARIVADVTLDPYATTGDVPVAAATGTASTWAVPWGALAVIALLALLAWTATLRRRRRRAAVQATVDAAVSEALARAGAAAPDPTGGAQSRASSAGSST